MRLTTPIAVVLAVIAVQVAAGATASAQYSRVGLYEPAKPAFAHEAATPAPTTNTVPTWAGVYMHPTLRLPMVRYGARAYWNPVTIALYGLQEYNLHRYGGRREHLAGARRAADWLVRNQAADGAWEYRMPFSYPREDVPLKPPWVAAQAQGNALSLLVRVWRRSGDARYAAAAKRALGPFERPVGQRGLRRKLGGRVLYEGFPTRSHSVTLEDFQLALLGLYDFAPYSQHARRLLNTGLNGLIWALPWYTDEQGRALYDLRHYGGNTWKAYDLEAHEFNAHVLTTLAAVTGRPRLSRYAQLWVGTLPRATPDEISAHGIDWSEGRPVDEPGSGDVPPVRPDPTAPAAPDPRASSAG